MRRWAAKSRLRAITPRTGSRPSSRATGAPPELARAILAVARPAEHHERQREPAFPLC